VNTPVLSLDGRPVDASLLEGLSPEVLLDVQRQHRRMGADLDHAVAARMLKTARPSPQEPDHLLTVPDAAKVLALGEAYVYDLVRRGLMPAVEIGKYRRIRRSTVETFMSAGRVDSGLYQGYNGSHGRVRTSSAQKPGTTNAGSPRQATRRRLEYRGALGAGRAADHRADGAADLPDVGEPKA